MLYKPERNPDNDSWRVVTRTARGYIVHQDNLSELKATGLAYSLNQQYKELLAKIK